MADHGFVNVDIPAADRAAAGKFYGDLFGWQTHHVAAFDYYLFQTGVGPGGGFVQQEGTAPRNGVLVYVGTDDIAATLARVVELGGAVVSDKVDMGANGAFAVFSDLSGNHIGLYTGPSVAEHIERQVAGAQ